MPNLFKPMGSVLCLVFALFFAAPNALADSITVFDITGSALPLITIGGTLTVDVTTGTITAVDIKATGFSDFTELRLLFRMAMAPGSSRPPLSLLVDLIWLSSPTQYRARWLGLQVGP